MRSKRTPGVCVPEFDKQMVRMMRRHGAKGAVLNEPLIGVRNDAGEIYRTIFAADLVEFVSACHFLAGLGLHDELVGVEGGRALSV